MLNAKMTTGVRFVHRFPRPRFTQILSELSLYEQKPEGN